MEKLLYLKEYSENIELVDYSSLLDSEKNTIPEYWKNAFKKEQMADKLKIILSEWEKYSFQLGTTLSYLKQKLKHIELIREKKEISLLYTIENVNGKDIYYVGKNPKTKIFPKSLSNKWDNIPESIKSIYDELHNGWYYFASQSNGLSSIENIIILGDSEWGILDEIDVKTLPFDLNNCLGFFHNGGGDYVCYDIDSKDINNGFVWYHTTPPKLNINMWTYIDEWTKLSIEA